MSTNVYEKLVKLAIEKSLLKEFKNSSNERIVYMDNNTEFQIQVFNPYTYTIGVKFEFNEKSPYNYKLLVLKPGERVWLDRYLDNDSKLLFSTYEVGTSKVVKNAISNNGKITIKFFKEKDKYIPSTITVSSSPNWYNYSFTSLSKSVSPQEYSFASECNTNFCSTDLNQILDLKNNSQQISCSASASQFKTHSNKMETGRIERGSTSNQLFNIYDGDFETYPFKTEVLQILPKSRKLITTKDLEKKYCHNCGRKLNQKFKFCPFCGAKQ